MYIYIYIWRKREREEKFLNRRRDRKTERKKYTDVLRETGFSKVVKQWSQPPDDTPSTT